MPSKHGIKQEPGGSTDSSPPPMKRLKVGTSRDESRPTRENFEECSVGSNSGSSSRSLPDTSLDPVILGGQHTSRPDIDPSATTTEFKATSVQPGDMGTTRSFIRQVRDAIDVEIGPSETEIVALIEAAAPIHDTGISLNLTSEQIDYFLINNESTDSLLKTYWQDASPEYPFLDKQSFEASYQNLSDGKRLLVDERVFLATLNITFALSIRHQEIRSNLERESFSRAFFNRARAVLPPNTSIKGSIEEIQYFLLLSQFFQSTSKLDESRAAVVVATRVAQDLDLHLPETYEKIADSKARELARRLWHGCIMMDRIVSILQGTPAMISSRLASAVPLPRDPRVATLNEADVDQLIEKEPINPLEFFVISTKLLEVMNEITLAVYTLDPIITDAALLYSPSHRITTDDLTTALRLDDALSRIERSLPYYLRMGSPNVPRHNTCRRQAVIMRTRILYARILLFRPMLAKLCLSRDSEGKSPLEDSMADRISKQCALACLHSARTMISTLTKVEASDSGFSLLPAWWHRVHYLYTAATVVLLGAPILSSEITLTSDTSELLKQVSLACEGVVQLFDSHMRFGALAHRCLIAVNLLNPRVSRKLDNPDSTTEEHADQSSSTSSVNAQESSNGAALGTDLFNFDVDDYRWLTVMPGSILY